MLFAQSKLGVEIFSPLGILILVIGIAFTVGLPVAMIKYGKKEQKTRKISNSQPLGVMGLMGNSNLFRKTDNKNALR